MPHLDRSATVAQIVVEHAVAARVFQKHKIDFCCHGNVSVPDACRDRRLDPETVFAELEAMIPGGDRDAQEDPRALSTAALVARIVDRHHGYLRRALPYIAPLAAKVAEVHGEHNPKLRALRDTFQELSDALLPHLDNEEAVLFPTLMQRRPDRAVVRDELAGLEDDILRHVHLENHALMPRFAANEPSVADRAETTATRGPEGV